jgi:hypothetical protein
MAQLFAMIRELVAEDKYVIGEPVALQFCNPMGIHQCTSSEVDSSRVGPDSIPRRYGLAPALGPRCAHWDCVGRDAGPRA